MIANLLPLVFLALQPVTGTPEGSQSADSEPATEASAPLSPGQQGAIRCSAAFALIAVRQRQGDEAALAYPPLGERGREFFVQSGARLMDEAGLTRVTLEARIRDQANRILADGSLDEIMPPCLLLLEASGI